MAALRLLASSVLRQSRQVTCITRVVPRIRLLSRTITVRKDEKDLEDIPVENRVATDIEQATGVERKELEAMLGGDPDPWNAERSTGRPGTKEDPVIVHSMCDERIVGCSCEPESHTITWMIIKQGEMKRCINCGNCFKVVYASPINIHLEEHEL